jgi:hypothetical protein
MWSRTSLCSIPGDIQETETTSGSQIINAENEKKKKQLYQ